MSNLQSLISHMRSVRKWAIDNKAKIRFSVFDFQMGVMVGNRELRLYPRFVIDAGEGIAYTSQISDRCGFIGWAPYTSKRWSISSDKMLFKQYCQRSGIRTPASGEAVRRDAVDFVIKPRSGSFGDGIRGPFRYDALNLEPCGDNEMCEAYISGKIIKAWYWDGVLVAVEMLDNPVLYCDGKRSIGQILSSRRGPFDAELSQDGIDHVLGWQGWQRDSVPEAGSEVRIDFRYRTRFSRFDFNDKDCLASLDPAVCQQLKEAGPRLATGIDADVRRFSMFTLDAVLDAAGVVWFLEMNSNPMVHPNVYPEMLSSIFNAAQQADPVTATAA